MKTSAIVLSSLLAGIIIFAFSIPDQFHHEDEILIVAQNRMIFALIGDLRRWSEWTKWTSRDPDLKSEFSTPPWGVGATFKWQSEKIGKGEVRVTGFTQNYAMEYEELMPKSDPARWAVRLRPGQRQGTIVKWSVDGRYPKSRLDRLLQYYSIWRMGDDLKTGLARLKKHAELHEASQILAGWEQPNPTPDLQPVPAAQSSDSAQPKTKPRPPNSKSGNKVSTKPKPGS
ncbi:MAG: hypothetical protein AB7F86_19490 [Bdellovibrionales bacterium]